MRKCLFPIARVSSCHPFRSDGDFTPKLSDMSDILHGPWHEHRTQISHQRCQATRLRSWTNRDVNHPKAGLRLLRNFDLRCRARFKPRSCQTECDGGMGFAPQAQCSDTCPRGRFIFEHFESSATVNDDIAMQPSCSHLNLPVIITLIMLGGVSRLMVTVLSLRVFFR